MGDLKHKQFTWDITKQGMKELGFRYDYEVEDYAYKFPVYKHGKTPVVFCKVGITENTNNVWYGVYDISGLYMPFYNREYGKNSIIPNIDSAILSKFQQLGIREVKE